MSTYVRLGALALVLAAGVAGASCATEGFDCGDPRSSDGSVVYQCDADHQLCICRTNSCAELASDCPSGRRYVGSPFAHEDVAHECVDPGDLSWTVDQMQDDARCPAAPSEGEAP